MNPVYLLKSGTHYDSLHSASSSQTTPVNNEPAEAVQVGTDDVSVHVTKSVDASCEVKSTEDPELDPVRILAALCANAPDYEVRGCLGMYSCKKIFAIL